MTYDQLNIKVSSTSDFSPGTAVTITISTINMPLSFKPQGIFVLYTDTDISNAITGKIESAADASSSVSD